MWTLQQQRRIVKKGEWRIDGLVHSKHQRHVEALTFRCLLLLHHRFCQLRHCPHARILAPASPDMLTTRVSTTAFNSRGQQSRAQEVLEVRVNVSVWLSPEAFVPYFPHWPDCFFFPGYEDDKVQLPFTVTDLKGRNLQLVTGPHDGQVCVNIIMLC